MTELLLSRIPVSTLYQLRIGIRDDYIREIVRDVKARTRAAARTTSVCVQFLECLARHAFEQENAILCEWLWALTVSIAQAALLSSVKEIQAASAPTILALGRIHSKMEDSRLSDALKMTLRGESRRGVKQIRSTLDTVSKETKTLVEDAVGTVLKAIPADMQ